VASVAATRGHQAGSQAPGPVEAGASVLVRLGRGTRRDPHRWEEAVIVRLTPTRIVWRHVVDPPCAERGKLRLDCEGVTWKRLQEPESDGR
jgi:hypothetical protein